MITNEAVSCSACAPTWYSCKHHYSHRKSWQRRRCRSTEIEAYGSVSFSMPKETRAINFIFNLQLKEDQIWTENASAVCPSILKKI